jgi:histone-lysine N-methyltransferase SETMAR
MELLTSHCNYEWLRNLITGDEKWVMYANHMRKRQWLGVGQSGMATPKSDLHPKMLMLSVWWGVRGVIHWELLPTGSTVTADVYCEQLDRVAAQLQGKQDKVYFLHDSARPHIAKSTRQKLLELGWIVLPHPPYSPDLALTDYHLFRSLADYLHEKIRRRRRPQNEPNQLLQPKFQGVLRTWDPFPTRTLATSRT